MGRLVFLCLLAGCTTPVLGPTSQLGQFTASDLAAAATVAKAAQEPVGAACWTYMEPVVAALPASPGVATLAELKLLIGSSAFLGACGPMLPSLTPVPLALVGGVP